MPAPLYAKVNPTIKFPIIIAVDEQKNKDLKRISLINILLGTTEAPEMMKLRAIHRSTSVRRGWL